MSTYTILGATGNTGHIIASGLLKKGHTVRIVTRDEVKAKQLVSEGAQHFRTSITDINGLTKAFAGADAAYLMIPGDVLNSDMPAHQASLVNSITKAIEDSTVKHAVTLSSVGAHLLKGAGVVQGLQKMEERFNAISGIHFLHLRATYFLENGLGMAGMAKHMGIIGSPVKADLPVAMVATKDIGEVALKHLLALNFSGKSHEYVLGARNYSYNEIAQIYGAAIDNPELKYVEFSFADAKNAMVQMGLGESYVDQLLEFVKALNAGLVLEDAHRDEKNTTPTTAGEFASKFKAAYDKI